MNKSSDTIQHIVITRARMPLFCVYKISSQVVSQVKQHTFFNIQWGSEYRTSLVFKWSKRGRMPNGLVFECHLNTVKPNHLNNGQMDAILFSYVLVQYSNGQPSTQDIALYQPFEIRTSKSQVFKWSVFRLYCSFEPGRSWTVAGTSLANMFPDQLRVPKRRDESSSSPDTTPQAPLRLSDMLKRKRVSKRTSGTFLNQTKDSHFRTHYYNVNFILIVLLIGIGGIISFKKRSGALVCHLLQDLKVPGSNLRLSQRRNDPVVG